MDLSKHCCRIFPIVLVLASSLVATGLWFFDEGLYSFSFLFNKEELINFFGTVLFIAVLPIGIFYFATEKESLKDKAKKLAFLGFLPALVFLVITVV